MEETEAQGSHSFRELECGRAEVSTEAIQLQDGPQQGAHTVQHSMVSVGLVEGHLACRISRTHGNVNI